MFVQAEWIARRIIDQPDVGASKLSVRPWITEVPGELLRLYFNHLGIRRRRSELHASPDATAHCQQAQEYNRSCGHSQKLDSRMRWLRLCCVPPGRPKPPHQRN